MRPDDYSAMDEVLGVVRGHRPLEIADLLEPLRIPPTPERGGKAAQARLRGKGGSAPFVRPQLLTRNQRGTRGWLKVQDGCDRRCSFCATKIARGASRSRSVDEVVAEARLLADHHRELVLTGIHIGHYGLDLDVPSSLSLLVERLVREVPGARFRLGSVEATEIDDRLVDLLVDGGGLVPHLHVPMQSGSDSVLHRMRRWHTGAQYRDRMQQICAKLSVLGLGADVIVGFPGESDDEHAATRELVKALPFTYLHVFAYSARDGTHAATLPDHIPGQVQAERSRELREIAQSKGEAYRRSRVGQGAQIVVEKGGWGVTEDYLRVRLTGSSRQPGEVAYAPLTWADDLVARL